MLASLLGLLPLVYYNTAKTFFMCFVVCKESSRETEAHLEAGVLAGRQNPVLHGVHNTQVVWLGPGEHCRHDRERRHAAKAPLVPPRLALLECGHVAGHEQLPGREEHRS